MGATTSKTPSTVARCDVIRLNVSLEHLIARSRRIGPESRSQPHAAAIEMSSTPIDSKGSSVELIEMRKQLLEDVEKIDQIDSIKIQEDGMRVFKATASSYRPQSTQPMRLPTDRTSAVTSSGFGGNDEKEIRGRLTSRDLRTVLRLHHENPQGWNDEVLADKYGLDIKTMRSILSSVGPPNVVAPKGLNDYPVGVWFKDVSSPC
ncbi:hypothetical protein CCR75_004080 [Bremia lactucae]|uniref:Uncharacterized protein n=1 Tax=Bremia lactucae TaxID=4779 RepID=A0A976IK12_BRELC|nr:hypothetical protein CCR75_004080 [Bremia lactucae]